MKWLCFDMYAVSALAPMSGRKLDTVSFFILEYRMKIRDLNVGTRLGAGFSLVLILVIVMAAIGIWRLEGILRDTNSVTDSYLARERLATEWLSLIDSNSALGLVAVTTIDPNIQEYAVQKMSKNSERAGVIQDALEEMITSKDGLELMKDVAEKRQGNADARAEVLKAREQGNISTATEIIRTRLLSAMQEYSDSVRKVVTNQQESIDIAGDGIQVKGNSAVIALSALGVLAVLLGAGIAWSITRSITRPLISAVRIAKEVAAGNLAIHVVADSKDQLGQLMVALRGMTDSLRNTVRDVRQGADSITLAAAEITSGNNDLSARTEEQAASVEETAATLEELTSTIVNTAGNTAQTHRYVSETASIVEENGAVMNEVSTRMQEIYNSSSQMSDIIQVIDGIAFQTNILALNAAVEAARAGESGRGFAVVAGEVRTLAQRSASAAQEIKTLIDNTVSQIASGRTLVEKADKGMGEIISNVQNITQLIDEIAQASQEQRDGISQINSAMGQIDTTTQQNAALVEQSAAAATSMQEQSRVLLDMVTIFKLNENGGEVPAAKQPSTVDKATPASTTYNTPEKVPAVAGSWETF